MKQSRVRSRYRHNELLLMMIPCALFFLIFKYIPMGGIIIAFKDFVMSEGIMHSPWVGWENFRQLFNNSDFFIALRNTLVISSLRLTLGFAAPIILALLLNEVRISWFRRGIQTLSYLPYFFSWVILGGIFLMLFSGSGPINTLVVNLVHTPIAFLSNQVWFIVVLILTGIWQAAGFGAVIYLAALAGINPELYEAASIDGASRWQQIRHVSLPLLLPTILVLFILNLGAILDAGFDQIYNMYSPVVFQSADIIDTYVLRQLVAMDFSLASAAGIFKAAVGLTFVILANFLARRASKGEYGIW